MRPISDKSLANAVMKWARDYMNEAPPNSVVGRYLIMAGVWSHEREARIKSLISSMAGKASAKSKRTRKTRKQKGEEAARQHKLDL